MRSIYETSASQADIDRRLRELIEYMGWKSGWETPQAYQHYFDPQRHSEIQDRLHQRLEAALKDELARRSDGGSMLAAPNTVGNPASVVELNSECDPDLEYLLVLGGKRAGDD